MHLLLPMIAPKGTNRLTKLLPFATALQRDNRELWGGGWGQRPLCYIPLASVHVASMRSDTDSPQNVAFLGVRMCFSFFAVCCALWAWAQH